METDDFDSMLSEMSTLSDSVESNKSGNNKRSTVFAYGYHFDSKEELDVYEWIVEAKERGFVKDFVYQPKSFVLFEGHKNERGKLDIRPHEYTADFKIEFTDKWVEFRKLNKLKFFDKFDEKVAYIDIKGAWSIYDDGRSFVLNQKWLYAKYNIYVWKVIPLKLFEKTWLPEKCVLTRKTKKVSKKYSSILTFDHHNFKFSSK